MKKIKMLFIAVISSLSLNSAYAGAICNGNMGNGLNVETVTINIESQVAAGLQGVTITDTNLQNPIFKMVNQNIPLDAAYHPRKYLGYLRYDLPQVNMNDWTEYALIFPNSISPDPFHAYIQQGGGSPGPTILLECYRNDKPWH
jgi:hypothetical protein